MRDFLRDSCFLRKVLHFRVRLSIASSALAIFDCSSSGGTRTDRSFKILVLKLSIVKPTAFRFNHSIG